MNPINTLFHFLLFLFPFFFVIFLSNNPRATIENSSPYLAGSFLSESPYQISTVDTLADSLASKSDLSKVSADARQNPLTRDSIYLKRPSKKKAMEAFNRFKDGMGKMAPDSARKPGRVHFSLKALPTVMQFNGGLKTSLDSLRSMYKRERAHRKELRTEKKRKDSLRLSSESLKNGNGLSYSVGNERDSFSPWGKEFLTKENLSLRKEPRREFYFPLEGKLSISSPYGNRVHPLSGEVKFHGGLDFRASYASVIAVMDGIVEKSGWDSNGGGYFMTIKHKEGISTSYLHLSERYYNVGEKVLAGYIIARSGNSGGSTGPHLHFMVREHGELRSPAEFLYKKSLESSAASSLYAQN